MSLRGVCRALGALAMVLLAIQPSQAQEPATSAHAALDAIAQLEADARKETAGQIEASAQTLGQFEQALAAQPSATKALRDWCDARRYSLAQPAKIIARRFPLALSIYPPAKLREQLGVGPDEPIQVRHVALDCGDALLSLADNWYVPSRLTPEMNATLDNSDTPFGTVAQPLHFTRQPMSSQRGAADGCTPDTILTHRALLRLPDGRPLALVLECYQPDVLAPPGPIIRPPAVHRPVDVIR